MKKTAIAIALAAVTGLGASVANAAAISSLAITDIDGDGRSGLFTFGPVAQIESIGIQWTGDTGTDMLWQGATQGPGVFTTGFQFGGAPFQPQTYGNGAVGDITGGVMTVSSMDFGGFFNNAVNFNLPPDAGTLVTQVLADNGDGTYNVKVTWTHTITASEDPTYTYVGFNAAWQLEGVATTVPVPAAVWLLGSGLVGLAGVARRRKAA